MNSWNEGVLTEVVGRLTPVPLDERTAILSGPIGNENHRGHFDRLPALRQIEQAGAPRRQGIEGAARVVFWNVERLRHIDAITETLKGLNPDVTLLCEIDRGMARTHNADPIVDLAARLDQSYLYALEFVELGLGDLNEQRDHAGELNAEGFHGAAVLSAVEMQQPFLIRLDGRGKWFDGAFNERRVGGTIALGAKIDVGGTPVTMVSVHLESHCDPETRAADMRSMLQRIDSFAAGEPVILGGDFNSSTTSPDQRRDRPAYQALIDSDPSRLTAPEPFEPLFRVAEDYGFDWHTSNVMGVPTQRFVAGTDRRNHKLDWFFTRGLAASEAAIIPALRDDGSPSSDHECLAVTIRPASA
ncbi:MAG TPA: endonuclease/exonuclease/phosphatase family protein [Devosiaceae bacterium]|jgi:endonuclease/exonuclease/phosphatase family metal-dependent hydrolase